MIAAPNTPAASAAMNRVVWLGMLRAFAQAQASADGRSAADVEADLLAAFGGPVL